MTKFTPYWWDEQPQFKNEKEFIRMFAIKSNQFNDLIKKMKNPSIVYDGRNILPLQDKSINLIKLGVK